MVDPGLALVLLGIIVAADAAPELAAVVDFAAAVVDFAAAVVDEGVPGTGPLS